MPQSILSNTVLAAGGRVLNVALGLAVIALITRYLGPAGYGQYVLLLSFGTILQLVADAGLYLTFSRQLARAPQQAADLLSQAIGLRLSLLATVFLVGALGSLALPPLAGLLVPFLLIALGLSLQSISQLYMSVFQFHRSLWRATVGDLLGRAAQIAGLIVAAYLLADLVSIAAVFALGAGVALGIHWVLSPVRHVRLSWYSTHAWRDMLAMSWPLGAMLLFNAIYFRVDTVVLSLWRSSQEVAWYGLAYRVVESALFFPAMFGGLLLPRLSETVITNPERARAYVEQGLRLVLVVAGAILAVLLSEAGNIIVFIAGNEFIPAGPLLQLLSWALVIMYVGNIFGFALVALERQRFLLGLYASLAAGNLVLNVLLIPRWGGVGAAVATIFTEAIAMTFAGVIVWRVLRVRVPWFVLLKVATLVVGSCIVLLQLPSTWPLLGRLTFFTAVYLSAIWFTGLLDRRHLALLRNQ